MYEWLELAAKTDKQAASYLEEIKKPKRFRYYIARWNWIKNNSSKKE